MALELVYDWTATLGLVFGGCCSNAITLEQLTSQYPNAGSLITLFQFVLISLRGLPQHITWTRYGPRFKPRRIPLMPYLVQVGLFYLVSLLNNAAFGYQIPMSVHIIFRSGGLVVSMVLGWLISGKQYNFTQVFSVLLVTIGVFLTTLSATPSTSSSRITANSADSRNYMTGILILSLALIFAGFLGLAQDWTYSTYGRPGPSVGKVDQESDSRPPQWQESLFYLHFLSLPMFIFLRRDIEAQIRLVSNGPRTFWSTPLPVPHTFAPYVAMPNTTFIALSQIREQDTNLQLSFYFPSALTPLLLNTITQLLCASGVHRLTTRVSSLTVTLILVVRKAGWVSGKARTVDHRMMWSGAAFVLVGTLLYSIGTKSKRMAAVAKEKEKRE
ncbi:hypothetical protein NP233_g9893 [Leucocoprinus birnbaumii]|uniref:UAA transporter n=1 Tax=Leucocoprinus birnbaumii TaxID=56174 RepID=A0AAD5YMP5_9AGAR|nr:hypothetical protein NP233_g9893 [Leucocoprinus birnbaumii]